ncbi:MAG: FtsX-like permease family protein [Chloroflexi bacterium]|nr:FtsX-like permease family protein [Chloroflexota bacterium]
MFDYALKNISKRWGRSLLTVVGVTVMITLIIVITGIVSSQKRSMHEHASAGAGKINVQPILAGTTYPAKGIDLAKDVADEMLVLVMDDIQEALSGKVLYFGLAPSPYPNQPAEAILVGLESGKEEGFTGSVANDIEPVTGVEFFDEAKATYPVILGMHAAEYYAKEMAKELRTGDSLTILDQDLIIIGILDRSADMVVNNSVIVPLDVAQDMLGKQGFVSSVILIQARVGADEKIVTDIQNHYSKMNIVDNSTTRHNLEEGIKLFENLVNVISTVVVIAAIILIMTVMLITVKERTREIGVLRAIGAPTSTVILAIFWEIFTLSAVGSILGGTVSGFILRFGLLENLFDPRHIVKYMPLAIVITLLSGILPAFQISRILPVESLQYE